MNKTDEIVKTIDEYGVKGKGRGELLKHLAGERLTARQMILAKCYDCMGYYSDGRGADCEIPDCPLYALMPYKSGEKYVSHKRTDEQKRKMGLRLRRKKAV